MIPLTRLTVSTRLSVLFLFKIIQHLTHAHNATNASAWSAQWASLSRPATIRLAWPTQYDKSNYPELWQCRSSTQEGLFTRGRVRGERSNRAGNGVRKRAPSPCFTAFPHWTLISASEAAAVRRPKAFGLISSKQHLLREHRQLKRSTWIWMEDE